FELPLQAYYRIGIGFLALDAPVFELVERDRLAGDGAAHEGAGALHLEIPVEIADARFPGARAFKAVHGSGLPHTCSFRHRRRQTSSSAAKGSLIAARTAARCRRASVRYRSGGHDCTCPIR